MVGDDSVEDFAFDSQEVILSTAYDNLDNLYFPRHVWFASPSWTASRNSLGADDSLYRFLGQPWFKR